MPNQTINYGLTKPLASEFYDVEVQNGNMDKVDTQMKANADGIKNLQDGQKNKADLVGGKVPAEQLPSLSYIKTSEKGKAGGVASLGQDGKVPSGQLPSLDYIPNAQKGRPNGVASLGSDGKIPSGQLPEMAGKPKRSRITLSAAGWKREPTAFGICHQSVAVAGILADETRQLIIPMPEIASQAAYAEAGIVCTNQSANSLTFSAKTAPSGSITVYVAVQEVTG